MVRRGGEPDLDDRGSAADRLSSMGLSRDRGWVPEPADPLEDPVVSPAGTPVAPPAEDAADPVRSVAPAAGEIVKGWLQDRLPPSLHGVVERAGGGTVLVVLMVALAMVLGGITLFRHHASASSYASPYPASTGNAAPSFPDAAGSSGPIAAPVPSAAASIVVDVGGRVRKPGLVTLPPGARVADAISAAGGPLRHRELAMIDLAARVNDGQLLLIGTKAAASPASPGSSALGGSATSASSSTAPVALNSATLEQLETLPGIGPVLGQNIIDWRTAHGGFTSLAQLQQVSGIGPATYADLSPLVTL